MLFRSESYRQTIFDTAHIFGIIDSVALLVQNAQIRHFSLWHVLGESSVAPEINNIGITYEGELDSLKKWINDRINWLDINIPGLCVATSLNSLSSQIPTIKCYPNPSGEFSTIEFPNELIGDYLQVYDYTGQCIDCIKICSEKLTLVTADWKQGVYLLRVGNKKSQSIKLVKE